MSSSPTSWLPVSLALSVSSSVKWGPEQPSLHNCQRPGRRAGPADLRPHHPEIWGCAPDQGRACGGALRCSPRADASRAHLVHTRGWGWGWGRGLRSRDLIGWWADAAARGRGLGSRLSFTSWPQVQLCTPPVKLPAGAPPLCPVRQRSPAPDPVPAASLGPAPSP